MNAKQFFLTAALTTIVVCSANAECPCPENTKSSEWSTCSKKCSKKAACTEDAKCCTENTKGCAEDCTCSEKCPCIADGKCSENCPCTADAKCSDECPCPTDENA